MFTTGQESMFWNKAKVRLIHKPREARKFIGDPGEMSMDICNRTLSIHDGITPGGCWHFRALIPNHPPGP